MTRWVDIAETLEHGKDAVWWNRLELRDVFPPPSHTDDEMPKNQQFATHKIYDFHISDNSHSRDRKAFRRQIYFYRQSRRFAQGLATKYH